jgi:hypothetical protein
LFEQIAQRRSNKEPYDPASPIRDTHTTALQNLRRDSTVNFIVSREPKTVEQLVNLASQAMSIEMQTPRTLAESVDRLRIGSAAIVAQPDGIDLHGPFFWWMSALGLMTREKALTPGTLAYQGGLDYALGYMAGTPSFGMLITEDNSRHSQLLAGRVYARVNLLARRSALRCTPSVNSYKSTTSLTNFEQTFLNSLACMHHAQFRCCSDWVTRNRLPPHHGDVSRSS